MSNPTVFQTSNDHAPADQMARETGPYPVGNDFEPLHQQTNTTPRGNDCAVIVPLHVLKSPAPRLSIAEPRNAIDGHRMKDSPPVMDHKSLPGRRRGHPGAY